MQHRALAENGHEYEYARTGGYTERFQPHGKDTGGSCLLFEESNRHKAVAVGSQRTSLGVAGW